MALVISDRTRETSTSTGTGNFMLAGAQPGSQRFGDRMAVGDTTWYAITGPGGLWETGIGTYVAADTIERTTPLESSNGDARVNFAVGTKDVFMTVPASQVVSPDALGRRLRFDAAQTLTGAQQFRALQNLAFNDYWSGLRGASSAANLRSAIDVDRASQAIYTSGGDENSGLAASPTVRLEVDFVARSPIVLINASCSFRALSAEFRFAYLAVRIVDLTAGVTRDTTAEQVVSLEANAAGRHYGASRTLAFSGLTIGNLHRVQLLPRASANNVAAPQAMQISGIN